MKFRSSIPTATLEAYKQKLIEAGHEATITVGYEFVHLNTTPAGEKWLRAKMKAGEAESVTAAPVKKKRANPKRRDGTEMTDDEASNAKFIINVLAFGMVLVVGLCFWTGAFTPDPPKQMTWKEANAEDFGLSSDFAVKMGLMTNKMVRYPRTKNLEEYRVFTIEPDSVTVVYMYSAENAFGVRSDHSVTVVGDVRTGGIARVVSVQ
jgi:hypothetical protein